MRVSPILLVDDNPMDVELALRAFRRRRLSNPILVAHDGQEALAWVPRWDKGEPKPLVILLDINMPRLSGLDVLAELKNHPVYRKIPVVVLTTSAESVDVRTAYERGANSYIVKPVDFEKFTEVAAHIELYWTAMNQPPD